MTDVQILELLTKRIRDLDDDELLEVYARTGGALRAIRDALRDGRKEPPSIVREQIDELAHLLGIERPT